mmetsp:Transcript_43399/g.132032  ORF Transcript_43399/g.132032 Transcript_43399/m.132032 type:complete len:342 (-) Transcript_43399:823-1848(-)
MFSFSDPARRRSTILTSPHPSAASGARSRNRRNASFPKNSPRRSSGTVMPSRSSSWLCRSWPHTSRLRTGRLKRRPPSSCLRFLLGWMYFPRCRRRSPSGRYITMLPEVRAEATRVARADVFPHPFFPVSIILATLSPSVRLSASQSIRATSLVACLIMTCLHPGWAESSHSSTSRPPLPRWWRESGWRMSGTIVSVVRTMRPSPSVSHDFGREPDGRRLRNFGTEDASSSGVGRDGGGASPSPSLSPSSPCSASSSPSPDVAAAAASNFSLSSLATSSRYASISLSIQFPNLGCAAQISSRFRTAASTSSCSSSTASCFSAQSSMANIDSILPPPAILSM